MEASPCVRAGDKTTTRLFGIGLLTKITVAHYCRRRDKNNRREKEMETTNLTAMTSLFIDACPSKIKWAHTSDFCSNFYDLGQKKSHVKKIMSLLLITI
jgi:hypothetical protein